MADFLLYEIIKDYLMVIIIPIMLASHGRRMFIDKRERGVVTVVKKIVFVAFVIQFMSGFINILFDYGVLPRTAPLYISSSNEGLALNTLTTALTVTVGLYFVFFLFNMERLLYTPFYAMGAIILYLFASGGHSEIYPYYMYIGGIAALVLIFAASFRLRDDYALGLAIFYAFSFLDIIFYMFNLTTSLVPAASLLVATYVFALIFAFGYFKPFEKAKQRKTAAIPVAKPVEVQK
jgi:hypothetical protein